MKKLILFTVILLTSFTAFAQITFPTNKPLFLTPDIIYTQKYNNTRASYDSIITNYGFIDNVNAFYSIPYCLIGGNAVFSGDLVYFQPASSAFGTMNPVMLSSYVSNRNVLYPYVYDKTEAIAWADTIGLGNSSVMTEGRAANSLNLKMNKSDTTIYARKTYVSSLYQTKLGFTPYNASNPAGYISSFTEGDPIYKADSNLYLRKTGAASLYQLKGSYLTTETDPTVPSYSKSLTAFSVIKTSTDALYATLAQLSTKYTIPTGTTSEYLRGNGSLATFPAIYIFTGSSSQYTKGDGTYGTLPVSKRVETYSGTTSGAGTYSVTFGTAYSVAPNIQANIINGTDSQNIRTTSVTTTGFTVLVRNRVDVVGLLPSWNNVSGATVDILISEK